jgi:hypothetical protein
MLSVAVVVGGVVSMRRGDVAYAAVLIWAFVGIAVKHQETAVVSTSAWLAAAITAALMLVGAYRNQRRDPDPALTA